MSSPSDQAVVLASPVLENERLLGEALEGTGWTFSRAGDLGEATSALAHAAVPIVLYDRELPGATWSEGFETLAAIRKPVALILLSNVSDPYLWDEVVRHGGFDVLTRPFSREEVISLLLFARTHCTGPWPPVPPREKTRR